MREQIEVRTCDRCRNKGDAVSSFSFVIGRYTDAAGSGADRTLDFELCEGCQNYILVRLFEDLEGKQLIQHTASRFDINARVMD